MFSSKHTCELRGNVRSTSDNQNRCLNIARFVSLIGMSVFFLGGGLVNASKGATVVGQVIFKGAVPTAKTVEVIRNPDFCGATMSIQNFVVDSTSKGVQGVVVSVEGIANPSGKTPPSNASEIRNHDCSFVPRIDTAIARERLHITNDDPIMHNTHVHHGTRTFVNIAQIAGGRTLYEAAQRAGGV